MLRPHPSTSRSITRHRRSLPLHRSRNRRPRVIEVHNIPIIVKGEGLIKRQVEIVITETAKTSRVLAAAELEVSHRPRGRRGNDEVCKRAGGALRNIQDLGVEGRKGLRVSG